MAARNSRPFCFPRERSDPMHGDIIETSQLPDTFPVFPLTGALLLPRGRLPLNIFEPRYLAMVDDALCHNRVIGMAQPVHPEDASWAPELYPVGCAGRLTSFSETEDGRYLITLSGLCRFRIKRELKSDTAYRQIVPCYDGYEIDFSPQEDENIIDRCRLLRALKSYLNARDIEADWSSLETAQPESVINTLAMLCPFCPEEKQVLLEAETLSDRGQALLAILELSAASSSAPGGSAPDCPVN